MQEKRMRDDIISRQAAIDLAREIRIPTKDGSIYRHRCIDPDAIRELPPAQPETIRCKDCIHRPIVDDPDATDGFRLRFPDFRCPCRCDDGYYSWMPNDNWFCGNGEKEKKQMNETDIDALVHKFSPEEWRDKIREGMNRLGLYFEGDEIKDERESRETSSGEVE